MKQGRPALVPRPVLGISLDGACSGDVDAEFSSIVLPGQISVVHKLNANRMSCLYT